MTLQANIDNVERSIASVEKMLTTAPRSRRRAVKASLRELRTTHQTLSNKADELYASLNIGENFPDIAELGIDFVKTLVMCHDAKRIVREKATGRTFEVRNLMRAVGGRAPSLGKSLS